MKTFHVKRFIVFSLLIYPSVLHAQIDTTSVYNFTLEDLVNIEITTATKTSGKSDLAPAIIEIVTGEQIRQRGYKNLGQLLNDISDNHEDRSNWGIGEPVNQNVGFGFRFDTGQNILLLYNGQRLNAFLPGNRFGGEEYLLNSIERVEIIRGPGSSLYGTSAFTLVVNIISKKIDGQSKEILQVGAEVIPTSNGKSLNASLQTMIGNKSSLTGGFQYLTEEGQKLKINNTLFGDSQLRDGLDHAADAEVFFNNGTFNWYSKFTNQQRRTFTGFNSVSPTNLDELTLSMYGYSTGIDKNFGLTEKIDLKLSAGWHQDNWREVALIPQFQVSSDGSQLVLDANGNPILDNVPLYRNGEDIISSFFIDGQGADTRSIDAEVQLTYNFRNNNNLVLGAYVADDRVTEAERPTELNLDPLQFVPFRVITDEKNNWLFDTKSSRQTAAVYGQIDYDILENLIFSAGARLDNYSGKGVLEAQNYHEFNPRGGLVYTSARLGTLKLLYGTATRIPNGFETLSAVAILGDPSNRPERIETMQFQWIMNWSSNLRTELGAFRSSISDRLETNAKISDQLRAQGFVGQFVNVDEGAKQKNNGIDGKVILQLSKAHLTMNFTQYFGSDNGSGNPIAYIPNTMINADINIPYRWLNLNAGLNYRGKFTQPETDPRDPVKSYLIARLNIIASPEKIPFSFNLTGRNILNTKYQYPSSSIDFKNHIPARGIEIALGVNYRIN